MIFTHDDEHVSSVTDSASDHDSGSRSWREHERTVSTGGGRYILSDTHGQSERHRDSAERSNRSITRTASSLLAASDWSARQSAVEDSEVDASSLESSRSSSPTVHDLPRRRATTSTSASSLSSSSSLQRAPSRLAGPRPIRRAATALPSRAAQTTRELWRDGALSAVTEPGYSRLPESGYSESDEFGHSQRHSPTSSVSSFVSELSAEPEDVIDSYRSPVVVGDITSVSPYSSPFEQQPEEQHTTGGSGGSSASTPIARSPLSQDMTTEQAPRPPGPPHLHTAPGHPTARPSPPPSPQPCGGQRPQERRQPNKLQRARTALENPARILAETLGAAPASGAPPTSSNPYGNPYPQYGSAASSSAAPSQQQWSPARAHAPQWPTMSSGSPPPQSQPYSMPASSSFGSQPQPPPTSMPLDGASHAFNGGARSPHRGQQPQQQDQMEPEIAEALRLSEEESQRLRQKSEEEQRIYELTLQASASAAEEESAARRQRLEAELTSEEIALRESMEQSAREAENDDDILLREALERSTRAQALELAQQREEEERWTREALERSRTDSRGKGKARASEPQESSAEREEREQMELAIRLSLAEGASPQAAAAAAAAALRSRASSSADNPAGSTSSNFSSQQPQALQSANTGSSSRALEDAPPPYISVADGSGAAGPPSTSSRFLQRPPDSDSEGEEDDGDDIDFAEPAPEKNRFVVFGPGMPLRPAPPPPVIPSPAPSSSVASYSSAVPPPRPPPLQTFLSDPAQPISSPHPAATPLARAPRPPPVTHADVQTSSSLPAEIMYNPSPRVSLTPPAAQASVSRSYAAMPAPSMSPRQSQPSHRSNSIASNMSVQGSTYSGIYGREQSASTDRLHAPLMQPRLNRSHSAEAVRTTHGPPTTIPYNSAASPAHGIAYTATSPSSTTATTASSSSSTSVGRSPSGDPFDDQFATTNVEAALALNAPVRGERFSIEDEDDVAPQTAVPQQRLEQESQLPDMYERLRRTSIRSQHSPSSLPSSARSNDFARAAVPAPPPKVTSSPSLHNRPSPDLRPSLSPQSSHSMSPQLSPPIGSISTGIVSPPERSPPPTSIISPRSPIAIEQAESSAQSQSPRVQPRASFASATSFIDSDIPMRGGMADTISANAIAHDEMLQGVKFGFLPKAAATTPAHALRTHAPLEQQGPFPDVVVLSRFESESASYGSFGVEAQTWRQLLTFLMHFGNSYWQAAPRDIEADKGGKGLQVALSVHLYRSFETGATRTRVQLDIMAPLQHFDPISKNDAVPVQLEEGCPNVIVFLPMVPILPLKLSKVAQTLVDMHSFSRRARSRISSVPASEARTARALRHLPDMVDLTRRLNGEALVQDAEWVASEEAGLLKKLKKKMKRRKRAPGLVPGGAIGDGNGEILQDNGPLPESAMLITPFRLDNA